MEEVKNFEKLVEDLKQDLTSIVATPKTREILDMIVEAHKQVVRSCFKSSTNFSKFFTSSMAINVYSSG